jgi:hypothetical protein
VGKFIERVDLSTNDAPAQAAVVRFFTAPVRMTRIDRASFLFFSHFISTRLLMSQANDFVCDASIISGNGQMA